MVTQLSGAFGRGWAVLVWLALSLAVLLPPWGGGLARAEVTGYVEQVGFDQTYRPGCWTPMIVDIQADASTSGTFQIRVEQEDLDKDIVSYVRTVALTPGVGGRFVVYFLPQGTRTPDGIGLPDARNSANVQALNNQLRVWLCDERGRKLTRLGVRTQIASIDPKTPGEASRGTKLVLYVREPEAPTTPAIRELAESLMLQGVVEDIAFVPVSPRLLPTSSLGYEGVDAVVWAAGGPPDRTVASEQPRFRALREWIAGGGRLVVMQHGEWRRTNAWGELLPVTFPRRGEMQGTRTRDDLTALRSLMGEEGSARSLWNSLRGPHLYGVAEARPGAIVERELEWPDMPRSVYLARMGVGAGCVSYVAQDLGSRLLSPGSPPPGWAKIWTRILDYKYAPQIVTKDTPEDERKHFRRARAAHELGAAVKDRMEMASRAGTLIAISVVFFLLYWLAAGPGVWVALRIKGRREWSWLGFATVAGAATLVTVAVVRLVLRGDPELRHFTLVRIAPDEPAYVQSRMGLYVPRDGELTVELPVGSADHAAAIAPYALHPYHAGDSDDFPSYRRYDVSVNDVAGDEPAKVAIPFRSTLKRLESTWHGQLQMAISGTAAIPTEGNSLLTGILTNNSGRDLKNVYLIFNRQYRQQPGDRMIFLKSWKNGEQFKLDDLTKMGAGLQLISESNRPDNASSLYGFFATPGNVARDWDAWIYGPLRAGTVMLSNQPFSDATNAAGGSPRVWPALSIFDRLPTMKNDSSREDRAELLRINARFLDCSAAVSAGRLVIVAEATDVPLPVPVKVEGDEVTGTGTVIYQFILPLDRKGDIEFVEEEDNPATRPAAPPRPVG